jgi:hypothetical protein
LSPATGEEAQLGAELVQRFQVGRIDETVGRIARDGDGLAGEQRRDLRRCRLGEADWRRQVDAGAGGQRIGQAVEAFAEIGDLGGLEQAEMAFRQAVAAFRQGAEPAHAGRQAAAQEFGVARAGDTVGEHAGKRQAGPVGGQAVGDGAEGLGHGAGVDQGHDRNAEAHGNVGGRRFAVEQAHHAFDQDQVGIGGGAGQPPAGIGLAAHAEVEVLAGRPAKAWICGSRKSGRT